MKKSILGLIVVTIALSGFVFLTHPTFAVTLLDDGVPVTGPGSSQNPTASPAPSATPAPAPQVSSDQKASGITDPLKVKSIQCLLAKIFQLAVNVGALVAVGYIIWAGFLFVSAGGDKKQVEAARNTLFNAIIGTALIVGAWVIATVIANTISEVTTNKVDVASITCQ